MECLKGAAPHPSPLRVTFCSDGNFLVRVEKGAVDKLRLSENRIGVVYVKNFKMHITVFKNEIPSGLENLEKNSYLSEKRTES